MAETVLLFDPTAPRGKGELAQSVLSGMTGKVVGFIDNAKPNFNHLADDIGELLMARYGVSRVLKHQKRSASTPAAAEVYQQYAEECDLVITGSGD